VLAGDFATGRGEIRPAHEDRRRVGRISGRDSTRRDTFHVSERGMEGTMKIAHAEGEPVYYGRVFHFTIPIPSFRDDNN
jgi:hypothetical protein